MDGNPHLGLVDILLAKSNTLSKAFHLANCFKPQCQKSLTEDASSRVANSLKPQVLQLLSLPFIMVCSYG